MQLYEIMDVPYFYSDYSEIDGLLYLPLIMNKVNDHMVSIYQPDSGYRSYISTVVYSYSDDETFDEMEHLYSDYNEKNKLGYYKASEMRLIETGKSGKKALLLRSYLGDKWCTKSLDWKLEFVSDAWQITGVYQADPIRIEIGTKLSADLDGDKKEDAIYYSTRTVTENGSKLELPILNINGKEYDNEYLKEKLGVDIVNASPACYYIIDLDVTDNYREFAILDEGNGSRLTHFFRYSAGELKYCGSVSAFPDDDCFFSNGYGKLEARKPLDILENWWTQANWIINDDGILEEEKENLYYNMWHESDPYAIYYAKEDISVYKSNDKNSETVTIKAGTRLSLTATDNKNWIVLEPKSQTGISLDEGWIYLEDGKVITPYGDVELTDLIG